MTTVEALEHVAADNWPPVTEHERLPGLSPSLVPHVRTIIVALTRAQTSWRVGQNETTGRNIALALDAARLLEGAGR